MWTLALEIFCSFEWTFHSFKDEKILFFSFCFHVYGYFHKQLQSHSKNFSVAIKKRNKNVTKKKVIFHSTSFFFYWHLSNTHRILTSCVCQRTYWYSRKHTDISNFNFGGILNCILGWQWACITSFLAQVMGLVVHRSLAKMSLWHKFSISTNSANILVSNKHKIASLICWY